MIISENLINIPENTEINHGPSEDSESILLTKPFQAQVVGKEADGAVPIRLIIDGKPEDQVRYFHQPPKLETHVKGIDL